jgi:integrase
MRASGVNASAIGLPAVRFHDLRHTCAALLLSRNVNPKIVSEMLGHASIAITLGTYAHVLPNMQESAVRALEKVLGCLPLTGQKRVSLFLFRSTKDRTKATY